MSVSRPATWIVHLLCVLGISSAVAAEKKPPTKEVGPSLPRLVKTNTHFDSGLFVVDHIFDKALKNDQVTIDFINRTIQINIPGVKLSADSQSVKVNKGTLKTVYTYQPKDNILRTRLIHKEPTEATDYRGFVEVEVKGKRLTISMKDPKDSAEDEAKTASLSLLPPLVLEDGRRTKGSTAVDIVKSELGSGNKESDTKETSDQLDKQKKKRSISTMSGKEVRSTVVATTNDSNSSPLGREASGESLPVYKENITKASESNPYSRMFVSLLVVVIFAIGLTMFGKWWSKNKVSNSNSTKIKVLTQHYIGPKKSLAIVRVAGESILIGVTDANISMIKTLSLIDEEVPEDLPTDFDQQLSAAEMAADQIEDKATVSESESRAPVTTEDDFSIANIKSVVANKLKEMRPI